MILNQSIQKNKTDFERMLMLNFKYIPQITNVHLVIVKGQILKLNIGTTVANKVEYRIELQITE